MRQQKIEAKTHVAIVGAGPVGILLAILLGKEGKKVTLIERWPEIYDRPRAVTMDHEIARILASLGIDCDNDPSIEYHDELYYWKNADLEDLQIVDWQSVSPSGWRVTYWFNQPELEARLLKMASAIPSINIIRGWEVVGLTNGENQVELTLQETKETAGVNGEKRHISAEYCVGADGANSFVREALNIPIVDKGFFFDWLILDIIPKDDYKCSLAQWQLCDPKRPTTIVPGGPGRRRWEFMVLPEESTEEIAKTENGWRFMEPWGLTPENAEMERSAVYRFQARWAEEWRVGRSMIAGDAAHLMPPFAGESMCAGFRDAVALGWRLNAILDQKLSNDILESYVSERIHHAKHYIDFSQELGDIICIADPQKALERDQRMKAELAARNYEPITGDNCHLGAGVWCSETPAAGELSTQGIVETNGRRGRFDQVVGLGWFILAINKSTKDLLSPQQHALFVRLGGRVVEIGSAGSSAPVIDLERTYEEWATQIDAAYIILRPDFYVAATANSQKALSMRFDELTKKLQFLDAESTETAAL